MAVLAFGVFLYVASKLVVPILTAVAVGMTVGPLIGYSTSRGVPAWVMAAGILLLLIAAMNAAVVTLAQLSRCSDMVGWRGGDFVCPC